MNEETSIKPPYLSYTTFKNFLGSLKNGVIPARIDKSLMVGQSGATQSYLMSSLRFFGLIDANGAPQPALKTLVTNEGDERKKVWKPMFEAGYTSIIGDLSLESATVGMLHEKFAAQSLAAETVKKCHSFFAAAADDAGVPLAPHLKPNARGGYRKTRKKTNGKQPPAEPEDEFGEDENNSATALRKPAVLLLDSDGKRLVRFQAPAAITKSELNRIQQWISFQLIVEDDDK